MRIKVWMKNSKGDIEILTQEDGVDSPLKVTQDTVSAAILNNLEKDREYGYVDIDDRNVEGEPFEASKTDLVNIINNNIRNVVTVSFNKKDGKERILTGFTSGDKDAFGRFYFVEIGCDDEQIRLVDPRELNWVKFVNSNLLHFVAHLKDKKPQWL